VLLGLSKAAQDDPSIVSADAVPLSVFALLLPLMMAILRGPRYV